MLELIGLATGIAKRSTKYYLTGLIVITTSGVVVPINTFPTAFSVKNYLDGQVGASDTLQEVTDNGNTTTNSVMICSSS